MSCTSAEKHGCNPSGYIVTEDLSAPSAVGADGEAGNARIEWSIEFSSNGVPTSRITGLIDRTGTAIEGSWTQHVGSNDPIPNHVSATTAANAIFGPDRMNVPSAASWFGFPCDHGDLTGWTLLGGVLNKSATHHDLEGEYRLIDGQNIHLCSIMVSYSCNPNAGGCPDP